MQNNASWFAKLCCTLPQLNTFPQLPLHDMDRVKRIWYLSHMRAAKVQASLRIRAVSPEPSLLAHTSSESRGTFRQKARSLDPLNGWACAVKICHGGMLKDTDSLDGAQLHFIKHKIKVAVFLVSFVCETKVNVLQNVSSFVLLIIQITNEPAHEIMVLITLATSESSGEPVHLRSLARTFAFRTHEVWK